MKKNIILVLSFLLVFSWCFTAFAYEKTVDTQKPLIVRPQGGSSELTPGVGGDGPPDLKKDNPDPFPPIPDPIPPEIIWPPISGGGPVNEWDDGIPFP